jgi:hypothetical protein
MYYFSAALHDGSPFFLFVVLAMLVALIQHEAGSNTGITHHAAHSGMGWADEPEVPRETTAQQIIFGHERRCFKDGDRAV